MLKCWSKVPYQRPDFKEIISELTLILTENSSQVWDEFLKESLLFIAQKYDIFDTFVRHRLCLIQDNVKVKCKLSLLIWSSLFFLFSLFFSRRNTLNWEIVMLLTITLELHGFIWKQLITISFNNHRWWRIIVTRIQSMTNQHSCFSITVVVWKTRTVLKAKGKNTLVRVKK